MKILLVHLGAAPGDELVDALTEFGHDVRIVADAAGAALPPGFAPDVIVARLENDAAQGLDVVAAIRSVRGATRLPLLVTGGNELALTAARRRFPEANFARIDTVQTALASIEAGE